ncbi:DUF2590 family protein [Pseudoalteromonas sp. HL-AS1]|uniref:DUF2590 family protein n=1 Tax=Pseudoalteromonas sp. HL-AS1 TaxID=3071081 RepID=UPI002815BAF3|nr:DUF2590 family protein [Pseudoalteromonas sp. HL-AS1]WMS91388.1 DUF2590 family protein [Pseudoalteromonas sp. HL-AS1]WMT83689.1 sheath initiator protein [Pseudoalteromonas phage ACA1]WMT83741.1 sheath initiator protein [Pseudoalteromonas phage ACA2]WMT83793.1 sheath initiator protein [Pseudoalteromonas phage proACA1-A]
MEFDIAMHIDLEIQDNDFVLNDSLSPSTLKKAGVIAQDIKHRILESGLLTKLVGLRNKNGIAPILTELELLTEQDNRIKPGTIKVYRNDDGTLSITAQTRQYGGLQSGL